MPKHALSKVEICEMIGALCSGSFIIGVDPLNAHFFTIIDKYANS